MGFDAWLSAFGSSRNSLLISYQDRLSVAKYPAGYTIVHQGAQDSDLLYVLTGHLTVVQSRVSTK